MIEMENEMRAREMGGELLTSNTAGMLLRLPFYLADSNTIL